MPRLAPATTACGRRGGTRSLTAARGCMPWRSARARRTARRSRSRPPWDRSRVPARVDPLVGAGLEELADPQAAGVAGRAQRRQHVVRADRLVAVGDRRLAGRGTASRSCAGGRGTRRAGPRRPGPRGARARSSSATRIASSWSSTTTTEPWSRHAGRRPRAWASVAAARRRWRAPPRRASREVVISSDGDVGPCSAWPSRSAATSSGSAVSSAMTATSVGPATRSIPTVPKSWRLASATYALPAPTMMSTGSTPSSPKAIAASAWTPPSARIWSAPDVAIA